MLFYFHWLTEESNVLFFKNSAIILNYVSELNAFLQAFLWAL